MHAVPAPLHIEELTATARDVIAGGGAMRVRGHLEADHALVLDMKDDPLDTKDVLVPGQRIFPRLQLGMPHLGGDQVHVTDATCVVLERGDLFRIGRP